MVLIFIGTIGALIKFPNWAVYVFAGAFTLTFGLGFISEQEAIASFGNSGLLTLVMLLLASVVIEKTSFILWLSGHFNQLSYRMTWLKLMFSTILGSAFLNNTAVVSTLIGPLRNNRNISASRLLIPLSYAAVIGGTLTLIGTSTNLIINSMFIESTGQSLGFFAFTKIALVVIPVTLIAIYFISTRLPDIKLNEHKPKDYVIDAKLSAESNLVGKSVQQAGLRHLKSLFLVEIVREGEIVSPVSPAEVLRANDHLLFSGDINQVSQLEHFDGLNVVVDSLPVAFENLTEVVVRPGSHVVGKSLKKVEFRSKFDAAVIGLKRDGETVRGKLGEIKLAAGDFLVLVSGPDFKKRQNVKKNFIVLSGVEPEHKLKGWRQKLAVGGFLLAIVGAALGLFSLFKGLALLLIAYIATGCLTSNDVKQRIAYNVWLIVGSAIGLSYGLANTEAFDFALNAIDFSINDENAIYILLLVYIATWIMTELVTNNAAAVIMFPIAYSLSMASGYDPITFIFAVTFAASASFISPYGYQTNLLVFNAGQYRLKDFAKAGIPVSITYSTAAFFALNYFYPLTKI